MIYSLLPFGWIGTLFGDGVLSMAIMKIPIIAFDLGSFYLLYRLFGNKFFDTFIFYYCSPIVFYICFVHNQLDIIPTFFLIASVFAFKEKRPIMAYFLLGLAVSCKLHILAAIPLLIIYDYKKRSFRAFIGLAITVGTFLIVNSAFLFSDEYWNMVFFNKERQQASDFIIELGSLSIYFTPLIVSFVYLKFFIYKKINIDLLVGYLGLTFSIFAMFTLPSPGWYLWFFPFIISFPIKQNIGRITSIQLFGLLTITYIIFFVFYYSKSGYSNIIVFGNPLDIEWQDQERADLIYTFLWGSLGLIVYVGYSYAIRSNSIYKHKNIPFLIGIGGDSGAGKTTILSDLKKLFNKRLLNLEGDGDHKWERGDENWNMFTHLDPKANLIHKQANDLAYLKRGYITHRRDYDHKSGKFTDNNLIRSKDIITISGLHAFYLPKARKLIDLKIFADTDERLRKHWKILRDVDKRGYSVEKILAQIEGRKKDGVRYIKPQKEFADLTIRYFAKYDFEIGNVDAKPDLGLQLIIDSNIYVDEFVQELTKMDYEITWDYGEDLANQILTFHSPNISKEQIAWLAEKLIFNLDEIIDSKNPWEKGYRGLIQLMIAIAVMESKKEYYLDDIL
jgi:uridine kinase